ncbi:MAG: amidohydrolase family protein [Acidimicrobiales bacterium]
MSVFDLVIKGGQVLDGTGAPGRTADIAVLDGLIATVGRVDDSATRVIDADGALVTPGFVDIHTHYDGQATWDERLLPSAWHGVTTVVMGNCGVGFAPVHPEDHDRLIELMEGVEDIPGAALHEGLSWRWQSFAEYLDALDSRPHDIDFAAQLPHGALRLFVMGERGANREPASAEEIAEMGRLAAEAVRAGALGFTTSRTLNHRTSRGEPTPTLTASRDELVGIAREIGTTHAGVLQVVTDFIDAEYELTTFREMMLASRRPLSVSLAQSDHTEVFRNVLDAITEANAEGLEMRAQVAARGIGVLLGLQATVNPFQRCSTFRTVANYPLAERVARLSEPEIRDRILAEYPNAAIGFIARFDRMYALGDPPDYEPSPDTSLAARAARERRRPEELAYDHLLADNGRAFLYVPILNYVDGDLDAVREMLVHPFTVPGLSDGGAHVGTICDASFPTTLLSHWGRDRSRGEGIEMTEVVRRQCRETAFALGLRDRGVLARGFKADLNVIDPEEIGMRAPEMAFDLPAGGKRLLQRATGYVHTIVSGQEVYSRGEATGPLPGRLVRGSQPEPAASS